MEGRSTPMLQQPHQLLLLIKATDDPISPINGMEAVLRPFSLVIPFTVQKGQITGDPP